MGRKSTKRDKRELKQSNSKLIVIVEGITDKVYIEGVLKLLGCNGKKKIVNAESIHNIPSKVRHFNSINDPKNVVVFVDLDHTNTVESIHLTISKKTNIDIGDVYYVNPCLETLLVYSVNQNFRLNSNVGQYLNEVSKLYNIRYSKSEEDILKIMKKYDLEMWQNLSMYIESKRAAGNEFTNIDLLIQRIVDNV